MWSVVCGWTFCGCGQKTFFVEVWLDFMYFNFCGNMVCGVYSVSYGAWPVICGCGQP